MIYSTASEISIHYSYYHEHVQRSSDFPNSLKIFTCRYTGKPVAGPKKTSFVKSEKNSVEAVAVTQQSNVGHSAGDADSVENLYDMLKTAKDGETQINLLRRSYKCPVCPRMLKTKSQMVDHMAKLHTDHKSFFCDHCTKVFTSKKGLQSHMSYHVTPKFVKCGICQKVMRDTFNLKSHMERHYNEACKNCDNCKNDLPCLPFILLPDAPFKCTICHKIYETLDDLKSHVKVHSVKAIWECGFCGHSYSTERGLRDHVRNNHKRSRLKRSYGKYKCPFCDVIFSDKHEYARHFNKHNEKKATRNGSVLKIEEAPLICKYCDKRFNKIFDLLAHNLTVNKDISYSPIQLYNLQKTF
uniref:C2H2-type domain-containing protein n=1 Tax=Phlebotomus papatasi TaxID=29031 RepID=A0A1B0D7U0_PHLPP